MHGRLLKFAACGFAIALLLSTGCSRKHWRKRADNDVTGVITQKNVFPEWKVQNWHAYPDPRARFADPSNPDRPPYPPDDYAARVLSPNPQKPGKHAGTGRIEGDGYMQYLSQWDAENRALEPAVPMKLEPEKQSSTIWKPWQVAAALRSDGPMGPPMRHEMVHAQAKLPSFDPGVIVISGEVHDGNRMIPALIAIPTVAAAGKEEPPVSGPAFVVATGDAAGDFLRALDTKETNYRIRHEQAIELGMFNSREFQDRREDLYLAALPVTLERFNFAAQGFFTETAALDFAGAPRSIRHPASKNSSRAVPYSS